MKRISLVIAALTLLPVAIAATAYYRFPHWFKEPLVELNRKRSGLAEKQLKIDAHDIHYLEGGNGETVVLLHGIFAEKDHWADFAKQLTGRYHVIVPDLPGFGESSRIDGQPYDYAVQTERLKQILDGLGLDRIHLAGNSMGGTITALFAIRYPERVASVAFIGAPHGIRSPKPSEMDRLIDAGKSPLVARDPAEFERMLSLVFAKRPFLPYPILHASETEAIRNAESNSRIWRAQLKDRHLLHERIGELQVDTLVMWGNRDQVFDVSGVGVLRSKLKKVHLHDLPDVGHLPMMEAPKETSLAYTAFLEKAGR